jgi:hypothetical protein
MSFTETTFEYERWLAGRVAIIQADLARKHEMMAAGESAFFRATFYRWAQQWNGAPASLLKAPRVLATGDLHVENFGTWRDAEGRLVWGVNDFDEAWPLPFTFDLVRLAASALIASEHGRGAILTGYRESLAAGGRPVVLEERGLDLRRLAADRLKNPGNFWRKLEAVKTWKRPVPAAAARLLHDALPEGAKQLRIVHRVSGLGSLGRERYAMLAEWRGAMIAREVKALAPSAAAWARNPEASAPAKTAELLRRAVRCPDPFLRAADGWTVRRLSPSSSRIELDDLPAEHDAGLLLYWMGWETANIHLGSQRAAVLANSLDALGADWLDEAAHAMREAVTADFQEWRKAAGKPPD